MSSGFVMTIHTHVTTEDQPAAVGLVGGLLDRLPGLERSAVAVNRSRQAQTRRV
jgi:hypothetical protein